MTGILPVREVLRSKRVYVGGGCPFCNHALETIAHILCECPLACQLWGMADVLNGVSLVEFVQGKLRDPDSTQGIAMVCQFWVMWKARNDVVWNVKQWQIQDMRQLVVAQLAAWVQVYSSICTAQATAGMQGSPTIWIPLPEGFLKCNVDASIHGGDAAYGVVLRNHEGRFIAACSGKFPCVSEVYLAEAIAFKEALSWLKSRSHNMCFVESDCLCLCSSFNSATANLSYVGMIVKQCQTISREIGNILVRHVKRSANNVDNVLAQATGTSTVLGVWESIPPSCIANLV
ncbi:PREDICTED: uncharacterized protein LOC109164732 [Ipomoea nil]|uniref:uncharacterized protein LOC109164732 n=1 Tax=Ipomoea nil TaxID=35883 RepID=UPI000901095C|nr:PREDICTED: uncharacterized protein LOC109164732 [Ipomoea nil]